MTQDDVTNASVDSKLRAAAKEDKLDEIESLLEAKADIEVREKTWGWTPLHEAAGNGACRVAEKLSTLGADTNAVSNDKETPLHLAAAEGYTAIIKTLSEKRADVNLQNADGETPLHVAVQNVGGKPGLGHIQTLLDLRADISIKDTNDNNVWETAGVYCQTNRADEIRKVLSGEVVKKHPDDPWPDTVGELEQGTDPVDVAESLREIGNKKFKEALYDDAIKFYKKAKVFLPSAATASEVAEDDAHGKRARACLIAVSSNAAACKMKQGDHDDCIRMCDGILQLDSENVKALYRKGMCLRATAALDDAEAVLRKAAELAPEDKAIAKEISCILKEKRDAKDKEKMLAKKMFS